MTKLRVVKLTDLGDKHWYQVEKLVPRFWLFGPLVWKTVYFDCGGHNFYCENVAIEYMNTIVGAVKTEVVKEIEVKK